jgi:fructose-1,6-bisphosphatase
MTTIDLPDWLAERSGALAEPVLAIAQACTEIAAAARRGAPAQTFDLYADARVADVLARCPSVAGWAGDGHEEPTASPQHGAGGTFLVVFDALAGSSKIDANVPVGTIFSLLPHPLRGAPPGSGAFLQPGRRQLAAGYVVYGPATVLVLSVGRGVQMFALDPDSGRWLLARDALVVPTCSSEFAINCSNQRFWDKPVQRYVAECIAGSAGPRARDFDMRWVGGTVADVHRILLRGGVFLVPRDARPPLQSGRLRLMHEAAPMGFLMEQAGARAVTGTQALLDVVPDLLHQRVPVILGSRDEVERIVAYHADPSENVSWQLFRTRSLFIQPQA